MFVSHIMDFMTHFVATSSNAMYTRAGEWDAYKVALRGECISQIVQVDAGI